ncbi:MAG TPA: thioredoxin family protein [Trueperaceae bacterium]|nr:thioredoxin family protein [Trueperaceae bacterium]
MTIKVLGSGCPNCQRLEANVRLVLERKGIQADVEKVTDYAAILAYGVSSTPALVVDEQVVLAGRVPSPRQLEGLLTRS